MRNGKLFLFIGISILFFSQSINSQTCPWTVLQHNGGQFFDYFEERERHVYFKVVEAAVPCPKDCKCTPGKSGTVSQEKTETIRKTQSADFSLTLAGFFQFLTGSHLKKEFETTTSTKLTREIPSVEVPCGKKFLGYFVDTQRIEEENRRAGTESGTRTRETNFWGTLTIVINYGKSYNPCTGEVTGPDC